MKDKPVVPLEAARMMAAVTPRAAACWLVVCAFAAPHLAFAQSEEIGSGRRSCGDWTTSGSSRDISQQTRHAMMTQWVFGFLSASALGSSSISDALKATDAEGLIHWIDNYCQANPLDSIDVAAEALALLLTASPK
jgi:hypothetical protein